MTVWGNKITDDTTVIVKLKKGQLTQKVTKFLSVFCEHYEVDIIHNLDLQPEDEEKHIQLILPSKYPSTDLLISLLDFACDFKIRISPKRVLNRVLDATAYKLGSIQYAKNLPGATADQLRIHKLGVNWTIQEQDHEGNWNSVYGPYKNHTICKEKFNKFYGE